MNLKLAQISIYIPPERSFVESNCAVIYRHLLLKMFKKKCASKWMSKKNQIKSLIKKKKIPRLHKLVLWTYPKNDLYPIYLRVISQH